ncbi:MAG: diguanylate cyclase [Actinomycetales bacterium]|nr:diguanylate cyclase [Actinomycetales bacterium]
MVEGLDQYQGRLVRGMARVLSGRGIPFVVLVNDHEPGRPPSPLLTQAVDHLVPRGAVLSVGTHVEDADPVLSPLSRLDLPVVHLGYAVPGADSVHGDNVTGMRALMTHLLDERGRRRPVLVRGIPHQQDSVEREEVFRSELARRGLQVPDDLVLDGAFSAGCAYREILVLAETRPDIDAVVAANDVSAFGVLAALRTAGLRVPEDVLVTGFDNEPSAELRWPGLTTVDQNLEEQGRVAAELLLARLDGARGPARQVVVPSRLVVRGTTTPGGSFPERLGRATDAARAVRGELARAHPLLRMHRELSYCRSTEDVARVIAAELVRLGVTRCVLAAYDHVGGKAEPSDASATARMVINFRDGSSQPVPGDVHPVSELLPDELHPASSDGFLYLLPLWVPDREVGYVLYEQESGPLDLAWTLRIDVTQALHAVLARQRLEAYAETLRAAVARRAQQLKAEVVGRGITERRLRSINARLQESVKRDGLTQVANRVTLQSFLEHRWDVQAGTGHELALLMVDVDLFKPYNDHYGHVQGDETLRTVARCLHHAVRDPEDLVGRYGGEEFAVVLPRGGLRGAMAVAVRFRRLLAEAAVPHEVSTVAPVVTASIGLAVTRPARDRQSATLVESADLALYQAKLLGRDRLAVADPGTGAIAGRAGGRPAAVPVTSRAESVGSVESACPGAPPTDRNGAALGDRPGTGGLLS